MALTKDQILGIVQKIEHPEMSEITSLGLDALPYLKSIIEGNDIFLAQKAASIATFIDKPQVIELANKASENPYPEVRIAIASGLWRLSRFNIDHLFFKFLQDSEQGIRRFALRSLAKSMTKRSKKLVKPEIVNAVKSMATHDPHVTVKRLANHTLLRLNMTQVTNEEVEEAIASTMPESDIVDVLGQAVIKYLDIIVQKSQSQMAIKAVNVASMIEDKDQIAVIRTASKNPNSDVRLATAQALRRITRADEGKEEVLLTLLNDPESEIRQAAIAASTTSLSSPAIKKNLENLAEKDAKNDVRELAKGALQRYSKGINK
jgi:HEAT repeat protein